MENEQAHNGLRQTDAHPNANLQQVTVPSGKPAHAKVSASSQTEQVVDAQTEQITGAQTTHVANDAPRKSKNQWFVPLIAGVVILALCIGGYFAYSAYTNWRMNEDAKAAAQNAANIEAEERGTTAQEAVKNPIDFAALQEENPEIYAWITIPGTKVDYPILQSMIDDNYYLRRDEQGNDAQYGALFTQSCNARDFSDPVTVVYGHNAADDAYFATLHYFENEDFFNTYQTMYVYTPTHCYTYEIIAAYQYDDRHIMNSYDFSRESERESYFQSVLNPESVLRNVREGAQLSSDSKILQLSTCMSAYVVANTRYIVTGVLVNEQVTY